MEDTTNTSREALAGGLIGLLKPAVEQLDERVLAVRYVRASQSVIVRGKSYNIASVDLVIYIT